MIFFEQSYLNGDFLAATDEVGRGPLAGPVVAAAVCCDTSTTISFLEILQKLGVKDSKLLSHSKRCQILTTLHINLLETEVLDHFSYAISSISESEIDKINILQASLLAMKTSYEKLSKKGTGILLIDGNICIPDLKYGIPIIKGDQKSLLIGLASIIAKEYRDRIMKDLDALYPGYGLSKNCGYPTKEHRLAIINKGVLPIHRKSFKGVVEHLFL